MEALGPTVIVVDTNLIAFFVTGGSRADSARMVMRRDPDWIAPALWRSELRNVLVTGCRAGVFAWDDTLALMEFAEGRMGHVSHEMPSTSVLAFARRTGCTAYHSEFGALAEELDVPLVTTDRALLAALPARAFTPEAFLERK